MFLTPLAECYKRVNKARCRHLRCFPVCLEEGHFDKGFCGRPVEFLLAATGTRPSSGTRFVAEFCIADSPLPESTDSLLEEREGRWFATVGSEPCDKVVFNSELTAYHYDWTSNRFAAATLHVFRVYIVDPNQPLRAVDSSTFTISTFRGSEWTQTPVPQTESADSAFKVFQAIRLRESGAKIDGMSWDALDALLEGNAPSSLHWQPEDSATFPESGNDQLVAVENMDALLGRVASFVCDNLGKVRDVSSLKAGLHDYLTEHENGRTIESLAREIEKLFGGPFMAAPKPVEVNSGWAKWVNLDAYVSSALVTLKEMLPEGCRIEDEFNDRNDLSGRIYPADDSMMDVMRSLMGWSEMDRTVFATHIDPVLTMKITRPRTLSIITDGTPEGIMQDQSKSVVINQLYFLRTNSSQTTIFPSLFSGLALMLAHTRGICCIKGVEDGKGVRMLAVITKLSGGRFHQNMKLQVSAEDNLWSTVRSFEGIGKQS